MIINYAMLELFRTQAGGYTGKTLDLLGIWPGNHGKYPDRGWKNRLVGKEISEETVNQIHLHLEQFEEKRRVKNLLRGKPVKA